MTKRHDPYAGEVIERINQTLKNEFDLVDCLPDREQAERETNKTIWLDNIIRPHDSCNKITQIQAHENESCNLKK